MQNDTNSMTLQEAADHLGVHYMTAYRYVRIGRLPASKVGSEWRVAMADLDELLGPSRPQSRQPKKRTDWRARFENRILAGDESGAWAVIENGLASSLDPKSAYLEVIAPALRNVGVAWEKGEIDVAEEHRATRIASRTIDRLSPQFASRGRRRGTVVLGSCAGDHHGLGTAMISDLLRSENFQVDDLGANVPVGSFVFAAETANRLVGVGISAFSEGNEETLMETIDALRGVSSMPIFLGGAAIADEAHARRLGADGYAADGAQALRLFLDSLTV